MGYILIISELFLAAEYGLFFVLNLTTSSQVRGSDAGISLVVLLTVYSQTTLNLIYPNLIPTTVLTDGRPAGYQCWLHWRSHLSSKNLLKSFLRQSIFIFISQNMSLQPCMLCPCSLVKCLHFLVANPITRLCRMISPFFTIFYPKNKINATVWLV